MSYGPDVHGATWRARSATSINILRGAKPADLPVEQPTKFEFVGQPENSEGDRPHDPAGA